MWLSFTYRLPLAKTWTTLYVTILYIIPCCWRFFWIHTHGVTKLQAREIEKKNNTFFSNTEMRQGTGDGCLDYLSDSTSSLIDWKKDFSPLYLEECFYHFEPSIETLGNLQRHWRVHRRDISPAASFTKLTANSD